MSLQGKSNPKLMGSVREEELLFILRHLAMGRIQRSTLSSSSGELYVGRGGQS